MPPGFLKLRPFLAAPALLLASVVSGLLLAFSSRPAWSLAGLIGGLCFAVVICMSLYMIVMKFSAGGLDPLDPYLRMLRARFKPDVGEALLGDDSLSSFFASASSPESRLLPDQRLLTFCEGKSRSGFPLRALALDEELILELDDQCSISRLASASGLDPATLSSSCETLDRKLLQEAALIMEQMDSIRLPDQEAGV